ncbi:autotransporter domain-containing protein [Achromobacter aegrifaciens]
MNFVNESTGTITGRVAFEASRTTGTGHSFVNAGTIVGGVSLGRGDNNTFTAVSGSSVSRGGSSATLDLTVSGMPGLNFAPPGIVNGGLGASNTLVLQNAPTGTGSGMGGPRTEISGDTYINFQNLRVNSGTWDLTGAALVSGGNVELNGGLIQLANGNVLGSRPISANGGAIAADNDLVSLGNDFVLGAQGLTVQGAHAITLAGGLSGGGHLALNGTAPVTLSGSNSYSGGTTVGLGAQLQGDTRSLQGDIVVDGALAFTQTASGTYAGNISGGGSLTKQGSGTLTLTGAHTYAGVTAISGGTLALGSSGRLPASQVSLQSGTTLDLRAAAGQTIAALSGTGGSVMLGTNSLTLTGSTNNTFAGVISGAGALIKVGAGTQTLTGANTFTGDVVINGGTLAVAAGALLPNSAVTVNTTGTFDLSTGGSQSIGTLGGSGGRIELGANTLTVGGGTYAGVVRGTGGINKAGTGTLTLNGANTYTGTTQVQGGALRIGGDASKSAASLGGNVNVAGNASLGGFGSINGDVSIAANGRLAPGNPGGAFTVNGNLTMQQGSVAAFSFGAPGTGSAPGAGHSVTVNGNLTLNGVRLDPADGGGFGIGLYRLFDYTGALTLSNGGIVPAAIGQTIQHLSASQQINLITSGNAELNFWNANRQASATQMGGGSGVWSRTDANWTDAVGTVTTARNPIDAFAIFGGTAGTVTVDGTAGAIAAKGIQFASDGYHLTGDTLAILGTTPGTAGEVRVGDGSLASRAWTATVDNLLTGVGINKTGAGTLVLNGANAHTQTTRISAGTLSVSSDANLGAPTAGLDFQGGTLRVTGTGFQNTARNINLGGAGGGLDIADAANTFTVEQALSGNGKLAKLGAGTLVLTGNNTYMGGTSVQAGTLQVGDGAISGSIAGDAVIQAGATLAFKRSDRMVFGGALSGAGELRHAGTGTLVLTGQNTLTGATTIESGTLQVGDGGTSGAMTGNIVNHGSLVFNRADDSSYSGALSGSGALTKAGAGSLVMTGDSSAYAGAAQLSAGTLQVDGKLGGRLQASAGTTLAGTGTLDSAVIGAGATLAPGNASSPYGRMNLLGDLDFKPGATYRVATTADGRHSSMHVAGTARLAGSVVQLAQTGNYAPSTTYSILTADRGVQGRFDSVSSNFAFLSPSLNYDANKVDLVVSLKQVPVDGGTPPVDGGTRPIEFADAALTGNQRAVARALQSLPGDSALRLHVLNLPNGAPVAAFNALSGESHASAMSGLQSTASTFIQTPLTHLRSNLNAGWMPGAPTAQLGLGDAASLPLPAAQPLWTQVYGTWTTLGGDGNAARTTQSDTGITIGGDHAVGGGWRLGGALGYNSGRSRTDDRASSTQADSYSLTVYGGRAFEAGAGKINLSLGAAYTWHDLDTQRNTAAAGLDQTLKASYDASTGQVFGELGYAVPLNDRVTLEPFIGANYSDLRTRGFSESGGDAALRGESGSNRVTTTTLGLHALSTFESAGARGHVQGTLGWRHAFGELNPASTLSFVQGGGSFTATGSPIARDAAIIELGVGIEVSKRTTVAVSYGGQFGDGNRQHSGTLDVRYRF